MRRKTACQDLSSYYVLILLCRPTSDMLQNSGRLCCTQSTWRVVTIVHRVLLARTVERKKPVYVLFMTARVAGRGRSELIMDAQGCRGNREYRLAIAIFDCLMAF
jgi:hypothetical protein